MNCFQQEWALLHTDIEKYERFSLIIKLFSVSVFLFSVINGFELSLGISLILILWLQDGIWKTFQKRMEIRVQQIESNLAKPDDNNIAFQFYSQWQSNRPGITGLMTEYLLSASKPTVAYPYVFLIIIYISMNI